MPLAGIHVSQGPRCGKCRNTEADCAYTYPCCPACTHFPDTEQREFSCLMCGAKFSGPKTGNPNRKCEDCKGKVAGPSAVGLLDVARERKREQAQVLSEPYPDSPMSSALIPDLEYTWWVAWTGTAHLWGSGARMSHCGAIRNGEKGSPAPGWYDIRCGRCKATQPGKP